MNRRIQALGVVLSLMFVALFVQLNNIQFVKADSLDKDPRNGRSIARDFNRPRGAILTHDGKVLAKSDPVDDKFKQQRSYPEGPSYAQVTGYYSYNYGASGIEAQYNSDLTGREEQSSNVLDFLSDRTVTSNVTLTVESSVQETARDLLAGRNGSVVALDPRDGSVLAMFSNPTYDPTLLASHDASVVRSNKTALDGDPVKPTLSRTYQETYAPGSTFKVVTSSSAYQNMPELTTKSYPVLTGLELPNTGGRVMSNFGGESCGGDIKALLTVSCNSGFGQMGLDLGAQNMVSQANAYGFNQDVPLDLPRPARSFFPTVDDFSQNLPFLALSSIGQGNVRATPLQMALVAATVANGGSMMTPHVMNEIRDSNGQLVRNYTPQEWRRPISSETAGFVRELMINVVNHGTARRVAIPGVQVAAKTGTAETGVPNKDNAWMIAFAPADNPTVALAVFLENAGAGEDLTGGVNAAPIAKAVITAALSAQERTTTTDPSSATVPTTVAP